MFGPKMFANEISFCLSRNGRISDHGFRTGEPYREEKQYTNDESERKDERFEIGATMLDLLFDEWLPDT